MTTCPAGVDLGDDPPDVVYVCRPGEDPELRYSLRSLAHLPHRQVWVVGGKPIWARVRHIPVAPRGRDKILNVRANLRALVASEGISERFYLFNDDFYVMKPLRVVPVLHRGLLCDVEGQATWHHHMRRTDVWLRERGIVDPLNYELHIPLPMTKTGLRLALDLIGDERSLLYRSVYGNLAGIGGEQTRDVKIYKATDVIPDGPWLSTSDKSFRGCPVGMHIRRAFRRAGAYERGAQ